MTTSFPLMQNITDITGISAFNALCKLSDICLPVIHHIIVIIEVEISGK